MQPQLRIDDAATGGATHPHAPHVVKAVLTMANETVIRGSKIGMRNDLG